MSGWGWTPDSFAAVGTVGALAGTVFVLVRDALERTRANAERLVVWIDRMNSPPPDVRDVGLFLYIRNDSSSPVHDLHIEFSNGSKLMSPVIGPGKEQHFGLDEVVEGTVTFTDGAGRRWRRSIRGGAPRRT